MNVLAGLYKPEVYRPDSSISGTQVNSPNFGNLFGAMDGQQSVVYDEAENRMHTQKAVMALTM